MSFLDKLEFLMKEKDIKNLNVLSELSGIPYTTLKGFYTKGTDKIKLSTLEKIKDYFDVTVDYLTRDEITDRNYGRAWNFKVDYYESELIKKYRVLDEHGKEVVDNLLNSEHERITRLEQERLEKERLEKEKTLSLPVVPNDDEPQNTEMKVYWESAAAGLGNYLMGEGEYDIMTFPVDEIPARADFGIKISGDSMEPKIYDGDIVWVEAMPQIENGEIGIFILDGDSYCKKLHIDYDKGIIELISLNPKYKPKVIKRHEELRTVGKVLLEKH